MVGAVDAVAPARARFSDYAGLPCSYSSSVSWRRRCSRSPRARCTTTTRTTSYASGSTRPPPSSRPHRRASRRRCRRLRSSRKARTRTRRDFAGLMQPLAAGATGAPFVSASIWPAQSSAPRPLFVVGEGARARDTAGGRHSHLPRPDHGETEVWRSSTCWKRTRGASGTASAPGPKRATSSTRRRPGLRIAGRRSTPTRRSPMSTTRSLSATQRARAHSWPRAPGKLSCPDGRPPPTCPSATRRSMSC